MEINGVIWLSRFVEKLARKHNVTTDEVEQVFANRARVQFVERGDVEGENLYRALGKTNAGRYLTVFFINKGKGQALVISSRDMSAAERKSYAKRKK
ncbi:MAG: BrnT family toxin [Blastocatellia bacterium]